MRRMCTIPTANPRTDPTSVTIGLVPHRPSKYTPARGGRQNSIATLVTRDAHTTPAAMGERDGSSSLTTKTRGTGLETRPRARSAIVELTSNPRTSQGQALSRTPRRSLLYLPQSLCQLPRCRIREIFHKVKSLALIPIRTWLGPIREPQFLRLPRMLRLASIVHRRTPVWFSD